VKLATLTAFRAISVQSRGVLFFTNSLSRLLLHWLHSMVIHRLYIGMSSVLVACVTSFGIRNFVIGFLKRAVSVPCSIIAVPHSLLANS